MPQKPKEYKIHFKHDKPQIIENWFENIESTDLLITIKYIGSNNINYQLNEIWRTNSKTKELNLINFIVKEFTY